MIELAPEDVRRWAVAAAADDGVADVEAGRWSVVGVDWSSPSPTTGGLFRVTGPSWSLFVKVVQSFRHWELLEVFPPELRKQALATSSWRYEADLYRSGLGSLLPEGMRLPHVYEVRDLPDDRVLIAMEDVAVATGRWDAARYARAAFGLGRLDVRMTAAGWLPTTEVHQPGRLLRHYVDSRIVAAVLPLLAADETWEHPLLAGRRSRALRADLAELATRVPGLLDSLTSLPHVRTHGDATPHNLLVSAGRPDELVVIDWAMGALAPVGEELGQLLVGGAHDGDLRVDDLVALRDVVVAAYTAGLAEEGLHVPCPLVRTAMDTTITLRSAFSALPLERLGEPVTDELAALVARRLDLTRHLVDVGLELDVLADARGSRPA
jgi:hypothetical protein